MESHGKDLRAEVGSEELAQAIHADYQTAELRPEEIALLDYAVKLTQSPWSMTEEDVNALRGHEFSNEDIVDAVHCISIS